MTLAEIFATVRNLSATVDAHLTGRNKPEADAASELPAIKAQLETFAAQFAQAEADLSTARQTIGTLTTQKATVEAEALVVATGAADLLAKVTTLEADKAALEAKWQDPKLRESAGAAQLAAAQGVPAAVAVPTQTDPAATAGNEISTLTGLAKVAAAFGAQRSSSKK